MPVRELVRQSIPFLQKAGFDTKDFEFLEKCISLEHDKIKLLSDVPHLIDFFLKNDIIYDEKAVNKVIKKDGVNKILIEIADIYSKIENFTAKAIENETRKYAEVNSLKTSQIFHPVRVAVSGRTEGPSLFEMIEILGKDRVLSRIRKTIEII